MKLFYFLFAFYTLSLAFMPCGDVRDCDDVAKHDLAGQHQDQHEEETCAPFCVCACCGSITSIAKNTYFTAISLPFANPVVSFEAGQPLQVSVSIWQPPKLG